MKKRFNDNRRDLKDRNPLLFYASIIPLIIVAFVFTIISLLILELVEGAIVTLCWNLAMPHIFGVEPITLFQAFILTFTLNSLRSNFFYLPHYVHRELGGSLFDGYDKITIENVSGLLELLFSISIIIATIWLTMYSWNYILPQLLNIELIKINFIQAFGATIILNLLFDNHSSFYEEHTELREYHPDDH